MKTATGRPRRFGVLLGTPWLLLLASALLLPEFVALGMSFTDAAPGAPTSFIGARHYRELFTSVQFWESMRTTVIFVAASVVGEMVIATGIALLLVRNFRHPRVWIALVLAPTAISPAVLASMWKYLFDQNGGMINYSLTKLGLPGVGWFSEPAAAMVVIVVAYIWHAIPAIFILVYPAALAVPVEYYEAARVDGAGGVRLFRHITLPLTAPALRVAVVFSTIWAFAVFGEISVLTQGGPIRTTETLSLYLYRAGFVDFEWGQASAIGVVVLVLTLALALPQIRALGRDVMVSEDR